MALMTLFRDDFNNGVVDLFTDDGAGSISEAGSEITLSITASAGGDWTNGVSAAPIAFFPLSGAKNDSIMTLEARVTDLTVTAGTQGIAGVAIFSSDRLDVYQMIFRDDLDRIDIERIIGGSGHVNLAFTGGLSHPNTTPHIYRIMWDRQHDRIAFMYSVDDGVTWSTVHTRQAEFTPDNAGVYARQFGSQPATSAKFDYLQITDETGQQPTDRAVVEDEGQLLGAGGPPQHQAQVGAGQLVPGPPNQDTGSTGPFDAAGVTDDSQLLDAGGPPQHQSRIDMGLLMPGPPDQLLDSTGPFDAGAAEDRHHIDLDGATFFQGKLDGDSNEFLGGTGILDVIRFDAYQDAYGFNSPAAADHYGAARDGYFYDAGALCGYGDFGTLAGGFRRTAWRRSDDEPLSVVRTAGTQPVLIADNTLRFSTGGVMSGWPEHSGEVVSNLRWVLTGDFDIQLKYTNWNVISGSDLFFGFMVHANDIDGIEGNNYYRVGRARFGGTDYYNSLGINNGGLVNNTNVGTADTAGTLRITRTGTTLRAFADSGPGTTQIGPDTTTANVGSGPVFVRLWFTAQSSTNGTIDVYGFGVTSGAISSRPGWAREASGSERGSRKDMPTDLAAVSTVDSIDLIDLDTNRLWMRFLQGTNNVIFTSLQVRPRRVTMDDGVLLIGYGSEDTETQEGAGIIVDFTTDSVRIYREAASVPGSFYGNTIERALGGIASRNSAFGYSATDTAWVIPDYRVHDLDAYRADPYEYHAMATVDGIGVGKWERWFLNNSPRIETSSTTSANFTRACRFDQSDGYLYYMDSGSFHAAAKATWEGAMDGGTFAPDITVALPGTRSRVSQHRVYELDKAIYLATDEGVYRMPLNTGVFTLFYGKPGSGATHEILPNYRKVATLAFGLDGAEDLLICSLMDVEFHVIDVQIVVIKLSDNTVYGKSPTFPGASRVPEAVGV